MAILIKTMDMPRNCRECPAMHELNGSDICTIPCKKIDNSHAKGRPDWCPLEEDTNGWIPVSERMPDDDMQVLLTYQVVYANGCIGKKMIWASYRKIIGKFIYFDGFVEKPIAWMPLPDPYEPEEDSEDGN